MKRLMIALLATAALLSGASAAEAQRWRGGYHHGYNHHGYYGHRWGNRHYGHGYYHGRHWR